jgi:replicative DNA helicase
MTENATPSNWELAADDILSVMLNDETGRNRALFERGVMPAYMPSVKHRRLFEAVRDCIAAGEPIHDTTVREKCGSVVPLDWYAQIATLFDPLRLFALDANITIVRRHGLNAGVRRILKLADDELANGKSHDNVTSRLMTALASLDGSGKIEGETADAMADEFDALMNTPPAPLTLTGIPWLDGVSGGIEPGHIWWIAAPYKSRKSTVMLNMALGLLMTWYTRGCVGDVPSIGIASREMPRIRISAQLVAMLAVAYIRRRNWWSERFTVGTTAYPLHMLSPKMLQNARAGYRQWDPRRVEAIDYGRQQLAQFHKNLRVYDRAKDNGKLSDLDSLFSIMRRDKHVHGTTVFFIDYLQLFQPDEMTLFQFMSAASRKLQEFAGAEQITLVVLAQQNEDTIKVGSGYSGGIKGGGDAPSTADYQLNSLYKSGEFADDPTKLMLNMKLSRHGDGGGDTKRVHEIHPQSGLLLESEWIGRL